MTAQTPRGGWFTACEFPPFAHPRQGVNDRFGIVDQFRARFSSRGFPALQRRYGAEALDGFADHRQSRSGALNMRRRPASAFSVIKCPPERDGRLWLRPARCPLRRPKIILSGFPKHQGG